MSSSSSMSLRKRKAPPEQIAIPSASLVLPDSTASTPLTADPTTGVSLDSAYESLKTGTFSVPITPLQNLWEQSLNLNSPAANTFPLADQGYFASSFNTATQNPSEQSQVSKEPASSTYDLAALASQFNVSSPDHSQLQTPPNSSPLPAMLDLPMSVSTSVVTTVPSSAADANALSAVQYLSSIMPNASNVNWNSLCSEFLNENPTLATAPARENDTESQSHSNEDVDMTNAPALIIDETEKCEVEAADDCSDASTVDLDSEKASKVSVRGTDIVKTEESDDTSMSSDHSAHIENVHSGIGQSRSHPQPTTAQSPRPPHPKRIRQNTQQTSTSGKTETELGNSQKSFENHQFKQPMYPASAYSAQQTQQKTANAPITSSIASVNSSIAQQSFFGLGLSPNSNVGDLSASGNPFKFASNIDSTPFLFDGGSLHSPSTSPFLRRTKSCYLGGTSGNGPTHGSAVSSGKSPLVRHSPKLNKSTEQAQAPKPEQDTSSEASPQSTDATAGPAAAAEVVQHHLAANAYFPFDLASPTFGVFPGVGGLYMGEGLYMQDPSNAAIKAELDALQVKAERGSPDYPGSAENAHAEQTLKSMGHLDQQSLHNQLSTSSHLLQTPFSLPNQQYAMTQGSDSFGLVPSSHPFLPPHSIYQLSYLNQPGAQAASSAISPQSLQLSGNATNPAELSHNFDLSNKPVFKNDVQSPRLGRRHSFTAAAPIHGRKSSTFNADIDNDLAMSADSQSTARPPLLQRHSFHTQASKVSNTHSPSDITAYATPPTQSVSLQPSDVHTSRPVQLKATKLSTAALFDVVEKYLLHGTWDDQMSCHRTGCWHNHQRNLIIRWAQMKRGGAGSVQIELEKIEMNDEDVRAVDDKWQWKWGEMKVTLYAPKVAQKSYGTEKRFLCPPPQVSLLGCPFFPSHPLSHPPSQTPSSNSPIHLSITPPPHSHLPYLQLYMADYIPSPSSGGGHGTSTRPAGGNRAQPSHAMYATNPHINHDPSWAERGEAVILSHSGFSTSNTINDFLSSPLPFSSGSSSSDSNYEDIFSKNIYPSPKNILQVGDAATFDKKVEYCMGIPLTGQGDAGVSNTIEGSSGSPTKNTENSNQDGKATVIYAEKYAGENYCGDIPMERWGFRNIWVSDSERRKGFECILKVIDPTTSHLLSIFKSKPIKVISKPTKKKPNQTGTNLPSSGLSGSVNLVYIYNGTNIAIFNRIRCQTVSTKYLTTGTTFPIPASLLSHSNPLDSTSSVSAKLANHANKTSTNPSLLMSNFVTHVFPGATTPEQARFLCSTGAWSSFQIQIIEEYERSSSFVRLPTCDCPECREKSQLGYYTRVPTALDSMKSCSAPMVLQYNQTIILVDPVTGLKSRPLIVRKVEKGTLAVLAEGRYHPTRSHVYADHGSAHAKQNDSRLMLDPLPNHPMLSHIATRTGPSGYVGGSHTGISSSQHQVNDPVSQLHKVAFQLADSEYPGAFLSLVGDTVGVMFANPDNVRFQAWEEENKKRKNSSSVGQTKKSEGSKGWLTVDVTEAAVWTVVGTDKTEYNVYVPPHFRVTTAVNAHQDLSVSTASDDLDRSNSSVFKQTPDSSPIQSLNTPPIGNQSHQMQSHVRPRSLSTPASMHRSSGNLGIGNSSGSMQSHITPPTSPATVSAIASAPLPPLHPIPLVHDVRVRDTSNQCGDASRVVLLDGTSFLHHDIQVYVADIKCSSQLKSDSTIEFTMPPDIVLFKLLFQSVSSSSTSSPTEEKDLVLKEKYSSFIATSTDVKRFIKKDMFYQTTGSGTNCGVVNLPFDGKSLDIDIDNDNPALKLPILLVRSDGVVYRTGKSWLFKLENVVLGLGSCVQMV